MKRYITNVGLVFWIAGKRFFYQGFMYRAAALAYATLLSIVPLLTISFTILTAFPAFQSVSAQLKNFLFENFVATSAQTIQTNIQTFVDRASQSSPLQVLVVLAVAIILIYNVESAFNDAWRVRKTRNWSSAFLLYWTLITLTPLLIGSAFALSTYVLSASYLQEQLHHLALIRWAMSTIAPYGLSFAVFTLLYFIVPNRNVPLRYALIGGIIATVLFEVTKLVFSYYITHYPRYSVIYGTLASVVIFLVWLYLSWLVVLFGALCSRVSYELSWLNRSKPQSEQSNTAHEND